MPILVKSLGIIIVCLAAIMLFSPEVMRKIAVFLKQGKWLYVIAVTRIIFGVLLIVASFYCAEKGVVMAVGILTLLSGGSSFVLGMPRMIAFIDWWLLKSDSVLRGMVCIPLLMGAALIFAA